MTANARWRKRNPWYNSLRMARERCNRKGQIRYPGYGGRGIACCLTLQQVRALWFRDKADIMEKPSLDREDPDKNYTLDNCSFMELSDNVAKGNRERAERTPLTMTEKEKNNVSFV